VIVLEFRRDGGGTEPSGVYAFFSARKNEYYELGACLLVHTTMVSPVKRVEIVSDKM
jgi:hypothetical protein